MEAEEEEENSCVSGDVSGVSTDYSGAIGNISDVSAPLNIPENVRSMSLATPAHSAAGSTASTADSETQTL